MKLKSPGLASLQCTITCQESRMLWLKEGDTLTRFFHIHANACRCRRFIHALEHEGRTLVSEASKGDTIFSFFDAVLGASAQCPHTIELRLLDLPPHRLVRAGRTVHGVGNMASRKYGKSFRNCRRTRRQGRTASPLISCIAPGHQARHHGGIRHVLVCRRT
jgi:hypothetical protein